MTGLKDKLKRATNSVASVAANVADKANQVAKTTMTTLTDLNGDGKVDAEDLKIALKKAKSVGGSMMEGAGKIAKEAADHPMVKDATAGAMVGGAIGFCVPLIPGTTATGAAVGAVIGVATGRNRTVIEVGHAPTVAVPKPKKPAAKKPAAKKPAAKKPAAKKPAAKKLTNA